MKELIGLGIKKDFSNNLDERHKRRYAATEARRSQPLFRRSQFLINLC